jgi:2-polyprenyl-6-methoxyphenol hydroxylase-like FAD-dependent oxidoreductase
MVSLGGGGRDYPPTDDAGFMEFARSLPYPMLYDAIKDAEPLTPITGYRATENRLRHYERLSRWPEGFVVVGDAACAFNPVYGQGMTTAGLGALALDQLLLEQRERDSGTFGLRFQKALAAINTVPWMLATSEDVRYRETEGKTPNRTTRFLHRYVDRILQLGTSDAKVRRRQLEVFHLLKPPSALFRPGMLWRVFKLVMTRRAAAAPPATVERATP